MSSLTLSLDVSTTGIGWVVFDGSNLNTEWSEQTKTEIFL